MSYEILTTMINELLAKKFGKKYKVTIENASDYRYIVRVNLPKKSQTLTFKDDESVQVKMDELYEEIQELVKKKK